jgi:predicted RNA-binding Zn-ribbon protein involved in translation (DUF1610 family)
MTVEDRHIDGNGVAGLLSQILAVEPTTVERRCQGCGDTSALGEHLAYEGAGMVLRCPSCGAVAIGVAVSDDGVSISWSGVYRIAATRQEEGAA